MSRERTSQAEVRTPPEAGDDLRERVSRAFADEELRGLQMANRVRLAALAVIALWITIENPFPDVLYFYGFLVVFASIGVAPLWLRRTGRYAPWQRYLFPLLDVMIFALLVLQANPFETAPFSPQLRLRIGNELYLFLFVTIAQFSYSPRVVIVAGLGAATVWAVGTFWIFLLPDSLGQVYGPEIGALSGLERPELFLHPQHVDLGRLGRVVVALLVTSGALAAAVWRSRRLVLRQAELERERTNLSRYFSPNMVEELARSDAPLRATKRQNVAVLFADIVGFTGFCARHSPEEVIGLLREFHPRMAAAVFEHGGTLDSYLGDGFMATFGTPRASDRDAANAMSCARAMVELIDRWNVERDARGEAAVRIGIGVHYGPVVVGNIGDEQHLEFAVVGDTVNVASRLQDLTRELSADAVVSRDLIDATPDGPERGPWSQLAAQELRGRDGPLEVWGIESPSRHEPGVP